MGESGMTSGSSISSIWELYVDMFIRFKHLPECLDTFGNVSAYRKHCLDFCVASNDQLNWKVDHLDLILIHLPS